MSWTPGLAIPDFARRNPAFRRQPRRTSYGVAAKSSEGRRDVRPGCVVRDTGSRYRARGMPVPSYNEFIFPLLRLLSDRPDGIRSRDAAEALADEARLTPEEREERLPSGRQALYYNRIAWAHDRLKRAGLSTSASRGVWQITDAGQAYLREHRDGVSEQDLEALARVGRGSTVATSTSPGTGPEVSARPQPASPEEQIDGAIRELNDSLSAELLEAIMKSTPTFFERLVLDVLVAMGYGADRSSIQETPASGDGGIEGIITLDRLGLEKVYVQAKRWANTVGRPQLQGFYGALAGRRATKGVFITTSDFSRDAREFAGSVSDSIVLVDGKMLTGLMIDYGVGVSILRTVKIGRIDTDYFEDD